MRLTSTKIGEEKVYTARLGGTPGLGELENIRFFPYNVCIHPLLIPVESVEEAGLSRSEVQQILDDALSSHTGSCRSSDTDSMSPKGIGIEAEAPQLLVPFDIVPVDNNFEKNLQIAKGKEKNVLAASNQGNLAVAQLLKQRNESRKPVPAGTSKTKQAGSSNTAKKVYSKVASTSKLPATSSKATKEKPSKVPVKPATAARPVIKPIPANVFKTVFKRPNVKQKTKPKKSAADTSGQVFTGISRRSENTGVTTEKVKAQFQIALPVPTGVSIQKVREPSPELTAPKPKKKIQKQRKHRNRRLQGGDSASSSSSSEDEEDSPALATVPASKQKPSSTVELPLKPSSDRRSSLPSMPTLLDFKDSTPPKEAEPEKAEEVPKEIEPRRQTSKHDVLDAASNHKAEAGASTDNEQDNDDNGSDDNGSEPSDHVSDAESNGDVLDLCYSDNEFGF